MQKTTVYIPEDVKRALTLKTTPPRPRLPLFKSGNPRLAERVDKALLNQRHFRAMRIERRKRFKVPPFDR